MNPSDIHILDLPDEILFIILKKLDNIDVLYSIFGINNKRLEILIQDGVFTNVLKFVKTSITDVKLDQFCTYILPRNHYYIKKLIIESTFLERILLAGDYPNLTSLELFNFGQKIVSGYLTDDSVFRHIFQYQITDLILHNSDQYGTEKSLFIYTRDVYEHIMLLFLNLKHLTFAASSRTEYPPLSFCLSPPNIYFCSTLTVLCINVVHIDDCLSLLDLGLKQLTTFIVQIEHIIRPILISHDMGELYNLKCFSLTSYTITFSYEDLVVPLLRRMTHLEKLTLYLRIHSQSRLFNYKSSFLNDTNPFVDGTHLQNEIFVYMPRLRTLIFYISTETIIYASYCKTSNDIQQTFTNMKFRQTACIIESFNGCKALCHVYSLPFTFTRLEKITTQFPAIVFDTVTRLYALDVAPMKHDFFMRVSRAFPLLKYFIIEHDGASFIKRAEWESDENPFNSIIEYSHLISLDIRRTKIDVVLQFLLETRTYLPCLTEFKVKYEELDTVTMNFTRNTTRRNCSQVKRLVLERGKYFSKNLYIYRYFPLCNYHSILIIE